MRILIIGGAGFIGFHLANKLSDTKKNSITLIDSFERAKKDKDLKKLLRKKNVKILKKNLLEIKSEKLETKFDYIFHLAAIVGVQNVIENPAEVMRKNIELVFKVIEIAKTQKKLKKICFASTSEIYAYSVQKKIAKVPTPENAKILISNYTEKRDSYFLSKLIGEKIFLLNNFPCAIVRLHNIYGPRMGYSHVIPELFLKIKKNKKYLNIFSRNHTRSFCYISDAVNQILNITKLKKNKIKIFNIGNDQEEIKIYNLAKKILKIMKEKRKIISKKNTPGSPSRRCPDLNLNRKIIKNKKFIKLNMGLKKTIDWYSKDYL